MNAQAATSIQKSAIPSKRAEIHATASALGGNHANARPGGERCGARPARRGPRELPRQQRDQRGVGRVQQDVDEPPCRRIRAVRPSCWRRTTPSSADGTGSTAVRRRKRMSCHTRARLRPRRAVKHLQLAVVVGQESAGQRRQIDDERRQRGQREHSDVDKSRRAGQHRYHWSRSGERYHWSRTGVYDIPRRPIIGPPQLADARAGPRNDEAVLAVLCRRRRRGNAIEHDAAGTRFRWTNPSTPISL